MKLLARRNEPLASSQVEFSRLQGFGEEQALQFLDLEFPGKMVWPVRVRGCPNVFFVFERRILRYETLPRRKCPTLGTIGAAVFFLVLIAEAASPPAAQEGQPAAESGKSPLFEQDVLPILKANCAACHSAKLAQKELNLSSWESLLKGSVSGPIVIPGKPNESRLYSMVHRGSMPPGENTRLADRDIATIRNGSRLEPRPPAARPRRSRP